jgi:hypothetical protein
MALTKVTYSMISGALVNVQDYGAVGNGSTDDTAAFIAAAALGKPMWMPQGDYIVNQAVTIQSGLFGAGAGDSNTNGKTKITLTGAGQLIVGDWYCQWDGFEVRSSVNNKTLIVNPGKSYWTFTNFVVSEIGAATGQIGILFDTTNSSIYFNRLDNINLRCDFPVRVTGAGTEAFNANKIGMGVGGNKWYDFVSAITITSGVLACDTNEFGGYFESGTRILDCESTGFSQNRIRAIQDNVTTTFTRSAALSTANLWEILETPFVSSGTYPQNQVFIGQPSTKIRASDTSSTPVIPNATSVIMTFDSEQFDTLSEFSNGLGPFQPKNAGFYQIDAQALTQAYTWPSATYFVIQIFKNGVLYANGSRNASQTASAVTFEQSSFVSSLVSMNGTTDTVDIRLLHNRGGNVSLESSPTYNFVNITRA